MRKKNFIFLSTLLLVLLLGLFTTSYASTFSANDFYNIIYNKMTNFGEETSRIANVTDALENGETIINTLLDLQYNYDYMYINAYGNASTRIDFYFSRSEDRIYHSGSYYYFKSYGRYTIALNNNQTTFTIYNGIGTTESSQNPQYIIYSDKDIWTSSQGGSIYHISGWQDGKDYTEENYVSSSYFEWFNNNNLQTIYIDSFGNTPISVLDFSHGDCYIGYIAQKQYLKGVSLVRYVYSTISDSWVIIDQNSADTLLSKEVRDDSYKIYVNTNINNLHGSIYMVSLISNDSEYENIRAYFYIKTKNDIFLNGGLVSPIFSGDPDYEDQNKHADTIDKIKDVNDTLTDDSQVDNILADNFSGDNLIGNLGYSPLENPFTTIIINTVSSFTDALLDSGNETLSFNVYNSTITLHSEDFTIPSGALKSFLSLLFNGFLVYEIIKYGFQLYEWINSGRLQNLVNETNNHQYYLF